MVVAVTTVIGHPMKAYHTVRGCKRLQPPDGEWWGAVGWEVFSKALLRVLFTLKLKYKRWREELPALLIQ